MRQVSIPKNVVDALNGLFDANPNALAALLERREAVDAHRASKVADDAPRDADTIGVFEVINTILNAVAPGKTVATIHGPNGLDGFVIGRDRKPAEAPKPADT